MTESTSPEEWEARADRLHRHLLDAAATGPLVAREGRDGLIWRGSREQVLRDLWPDVRGTSRTHPYGGSLSRHLRGSLVKTGTEGREQVWWIALDRAAPVRDPLQCPDPDCGRRFASIPARRGHQASHGTGLRAAGQAERDLAQARTLAPLIAAELAAMSAPANCIVYADGHHRCECSETWKTGKPAPVASVWPPLDLTTPTGGTP